MANQAQQQRGGNSRKSSLLLLLAFLIGRFPSPDNLRLRIVVRRNFLGNLRRQRATDHHCGWLNCRRCTGRQFKVNDVNYLVELQMIDIDFELLRNRGSLTNKLNRVQNMLDNTAVLRAGSPPICTVGNLAGRYSSPETYSTYPSYSAENVEAAEAYGANYGDDVSGSAYYAAYSMPVKETKSHCFSFLWPFGKKSRKATTHSPDCPYHHMRIDAGNGTYSDRYDGTLVEMTNEMEADYVDSDIEPAPLNPTLRESPPFPVLSGEKEIMGEIPLDLNGPILETPIGTPQLAPIPDFSHIPNHARRDMAVETRQEKHESPLTAPNSQSTSSPQISRSSRTPQLVFTPETTVR